MASSETLPVPVTFSTLKGSARFLIPDFMSRLPSLKTGRNSPQNGEDTTEKKKRAWKYYGYPEFSKWMASSNDFFVIRRFGRLNARVILLMQSKIAEKGDELDSYDEECRKVQEDGPTNDTVRLDCHQQRPKLLEELKGLLKEYNEYVSAYAELKGRHTADEQQIGNVRAWMTNYPNAILEDERKFYPRGLHELEKSGFVDERADLIPLLPRTRSNFHILVNKIQWIRLSRLFRVDPVPSRTEAPTTLYNSERGVDSFVNSVIVVFGMSMLLGPLWWLNWVEADTHKLGVITGFVFVFAVVLACAAVNKPFEVLAGTAAYAAVLMVFMQKSS